MGAVKLELRCPQRVGGVVIDPEPDWSFSTLVSELISIEEKLSASAPFPSPFCKTKSSVVFSAKSVKRSAFVMHVDEIEDDEEDSEEEAHDQPIVAGRRFTCDDFYISDSDDTEVELPCARYSLMDKVGLVESAILALTHQREFSAKEEIRNQVLALETDLINKNKEVIYAHERANKEYTEAWKDIERRQDMQYRRNIAEKLNNHLTVVQRDREHKSQIEKRRRRDDAATEEAERREKVLLEEKVRQEKARLEAEKKRAKEAKVAAVETDKKAAKEAEEKVAKKDSARAAAVASKAIGHHTGASSVIVNNESSGFRFDGVKEVLQAGNTFKCAKSARGLEERRQQIYKEVTIKNEELRLGYSSVSDTVEVIRLQNSRGFRIAPFLFILWKCFGLFWSGLVGLMQLLLVLSIKLCTQAWKDIERRQDMQYRRNIAEELNNHLTVVQRDREHKSQIEERRIRDDAATEEAERREKVLLEEKVWQEKARLEAEKKRAEEAKVAAVETDKKAAKEAEEKVAKKDSARAAAVASKAIGHHTGASSVIVNNESNEFRFDGVKEVLQAGNTFKCAESARGLEERRQQIYKEVAIKNEELRLGYSSDPLIHGSKIRRLIRTISGLKDNARTRVDQLLEIFFDSSCPQSMSVAMFAEKILDQCLIPNKTVFAYAVVIVRVSSQVPLAMDLLLAQLNRACTYTVPKHIAYSKSLFGTKEAYHKAIGYKEKDGVIESEESYVLRIDSCMRLYGALVQTEDEGVQNIHGLTEGWAWLARFLNALPANLYTAVALLAFLEMAGFALYRRYKAQFKKVLNIIDRDFLTALKEQGGDAKLKIVITSIQSYLKSNKFLEEPEGRSLRSFSYSREFVG